MSQFDGSDYGALIIEEIYSYLKEVGEEDSFSAECTRSLEQYWQENDITLYF